ncbi:putative protein phosphatase 2C 12 [Auxenochlorella protothecoides]|uniref:PPM-type phosphatase domain-containing protein n=1 Tax=Auxenochlorella protothecoides TaxID=3075 RepID=A0A087SII2_AUXPR|nr:putative protein phosphatase 2C 12 [Auxenochlorella protothecoides]KFM25536.1 putative protein phosphatase 2C 12 [Auxenochlorella protothecoides]RMZ54681.1 hypothetical protein APUTEX25_003059 [Auxenochlorella protothecoides]|eukprot:RMZ54681.1 hypothetical protein APUTEX25_003059 [Auxenochlorella protothecoides]
MVLIGTATLTGSRYGNLNQDFVVVEQLLTARQMKALKLPQCYVAAVLDGHGMLGEDASREAGRAIAASLRTAPALHTRGLAALSDAEVEALLGAAFQAGHKAALGVAAHAPGVYTYPRGARGAQTYVLKSLDGGDKAYIDPHLGARILEYGTTATVALVQGRALALANVGDSLAVVGREEGGAYHVDLVSTRHYGADSGERARLAAEVGDAVAVESEDGYISVREGRMRGYQLAMTRALGHRLLSKLGVSQAPSVVRRTLGPDDLCLILASDGVWEVFSPSEAVLTLCDHLAAGHSAPEAALDLVRTAVEVSDGTNVDIGADNTTAAVFVFDDLLD